MDLCEKRLNVLIKQGWGMTELSPLGSGVPDEYLHQNGWALDEVRKGASGMLPAHAEAKVVDVLGCIVGFSVGGSLGVIVGLSDGTDNSLGSAVGFSEGSPVSVGQRVGTSVGYGVGVGHAVGLSVGRAETGSLGSAVGS
jgi:hypothetical protein